MEPDISDIFLSAGCFIACVFVAASLFYWAEPLDFIDSLYLAFVTMEGIGLGDVVPITPPGRAVACLFALIGIGFWSIAFATLQFIHAKNVYLKEQQFLISISHPLEEITTIEPTSDPQKTESTRVGFWKKIFLFFFYNDLTLSAISSIILLITGAAIFMEIEGYDEETRLIWTYGHSLYFVTNILTRVAYGDFSPKTKGGRTFFLFYVFFGLIVVAHFMQEIVDLIFYGLKRLFKLFLHCYPEKRSHNIFSRLKERIVLSRETLDFVSNFILGNLLFMVVLWAGVWIFHQTEDDSFLSLLYLSTVTCTALGLGNVVPKSSAGRGLSCVIGFFGVGFFTSTIVGWQQFLFFRKWKKRLSQQEKTKAVELQANKSDHSVESSNPPLEKTTS